MAETGYTDTAAAMPQNGTAPNGKKVFPAGTGADWLTRAYDDMKAMGGIALTYFNVSAATNNEPADWTWPLNTTKTTTYTSVLANSNRLTDPSTTTVTPFGSRLRPPGRRRCTGRHGRGLPAQTPSTAAAVSGTPARLRGEAPCRGQGHGAQVGSGAAHQCEPEQGPLVLAVPG